MTSFRIPSLFLLGIALVGCTVGYPPNFYDQDMLVDFPLLPHTEDVPVYFPHDTLPDEEYLRVGVLEARGGEFTSYNELIRRLQFQAQERGVDAIQLMNKEVEADEYYGTSILSGIGIKYIKSLDYLNDFVRSQEIYLTNGNHVSPDSSQWVSKIWFDFNGEVERVEGDQNYAQFIRKYSLDYLLYSISRRWRYAVDEYGELRLRVNYSATGAVNLRAWFSYQMRERPNFIRIREYPSRAESTLWFAYDVEAKMLKKRITLPNGDVMDQIPVYNAAGKLLKSEYYKLDADQQLTPYLLVVHQFYSPDDVQERVVLK
ncbi:MAG: hypothetical protein AAGE93_16870 [Bacteroidota bacterium]